jgi:ADP-ribose pyrophosphatase YjhB (NUDIX family)
VTGEHPAVSAREQPRVTPFTALAARLLLTLGDRVLVANRRGESWCFLIGGDVEAGENVESALHRIVRRTAGLTLHSLDFVGVVENAYREDSGRSWQQVNVIFAAEVPRFGEIGSRVDEIDIVSIALEDLHTVEFRPAYLGAVIMTWFNRRAPQWHGPHGPAAGSLPVVPPQP